MLVHSVLQTAFKVENYSFTSSYDVKIVKKKFISGLFLLFIKFIFVLWI